RRFPFAFGMNTGVSKRPGSFQDLPSLGDFSPKGLVQIARRFNAGKNVKKLKVPQGRLKTPQHTTRQKKLRCAFSRQTRQWCNRNRWTPNFSYITFAVT